MNLTNGRRPAKIYPVIEAGIDQSHSSVIVYAPPENEAATN
jgi:hypothetical protein